MAVIVSIRYSIANGQPEDRKITLPDGTPYADAVKAVYHEIKAAKDNNEMIEISRFTNEIAHAPRHSVLINPHHITSVGIFVNEKG
jgi:hypothetical protein